MKQRNTVIFPHCGELLAFGLALVLCAGPSSGQQAAPAAPQRQREAEWEKNLLDLSPNVATDRLRTTLEQGDDESKVRAMRMLGDLKARSAVPDILTLLHGTKDTRMVLVASHTLGTIGDPRALPLLSDWASNRSETPDRRRAAIIALGLLGDRSAVGVLERIATEDDELLRVFAAGSLGMLGNQKGLDAALAGLSSTNASVRRHSIQALGFIGGKVAAARLDDLVRQSPPKVESDSIDLARLQLEVADEQPGERVARIKARVSAETRNGQLVAWGLRELGKGGQEGSDALRGIASGHVSENIRKQAERAATLSSLRARIQQEEK